MNLNELHKRVIAAARAITPDERVPYAFEKRIMAQIRHAARVDIWSVWSAGLWRAAASCIAIAMLAGAWVLWSQQHQPEMEFSKQFESAVFASTSPEEAW